MYSATPLPRDVFHVDGAFNGVGVGKEFPSGVVGTLNFKLQHDSRKAFFDILSVNVRLQRLARPRSQTEMEVHKDGADK